MKISRFAILLSLVAFLSTATVAQERPEWRKAFEKFDAKGTIVVADWRTTDRPVMFFDQERAARRYSPASTFKIPHTLFALDAGAVRDEFQVFKWDGVPRSFSGHNADQTLRSAMRFSTLWVLSAVREADRHQKGPKIPETDRLRQCRSDDRDR